MTKQTPILFKPWKVREILDWRWEESAMMTRRISGLDAINENPRWWTSILRYEEGKSEVFSHQLFPDTVEPVIVKSRWGGTGDLLWVKEALLVEINATKSDIECGHFTYKADDIKDEWTKENGYKTLSPLFMPKVFARIWLQLVGVKVERLQDISREDARAEGVSSVWHWDGDRDPKYFERGALNPYVANFSMIWDEINGKTPYTWDANSWVWVLEFKRVSQS